MEGRWPVWLLATVGVALVGLVIIQALWIRDIRALQEAQFAQGVENALYAVSDRLERTEKLRVLQQHEAGRWLLERSDSLDGANVPGMVSLVMRGGDAWQEMPRQSLVDTDAAQQFTPPGEVLKRSAHQDREELVAELVRDILASERMPDIRVRIDAGLLDTLIAEELLAHGLYGVYHYGLFSEQGNAVYAPPTSSAAGAELSATPFRERLFRHDIAGPVYLLHMHFPERRTGIGGAIVPMLISSGLFIVVILLAFIFVVRILQRQKRIGEIRNDLVNNLTHELKTPISTIALACEAMSDPSMPRTEEQVRSYTTMIRDENKRLGALVENVLQSAVLDSGRMLLKRVDLDLHTVVQDVVRSSSMQVSRRNGRIETDLQAEIHHVQGDRIHLTNLLYNLIDNAVKYTEQEPRIRIVTRSDDQGITLSVADNGIGIPSAEQSKVFERLYRVPTGNIHNAKGFGLGLSYVKTVVERHGGRIRLESQAGRGSTFHIFIPFEDGSSQAVAR